VTVRLLMLCERLNRVGEAQALLAQLPPPASVTDPDLQSDIINAHAALAARENDYRKASDLLEAAGRIGTPGSEFFFTLARIRDKLGDVDGTMQALTRAHELQMQKASLMIPELIASGAEPLTAGLDPISAESRQLWAICPPPASTESPIFIMGFPRSGTTMLEQMLDAVPSLRAMDEQPFLQSVVERIEQNGLRYPRDLHRLDAVQCDELRKLYWSLVRKTVKLEPGQRLVDKNPLNMLRLPLVNRLFPRSRIIFAMRHPCDVVLSNYMQSFGAPAFMLLCSTLERLARGYVNAMQGWLHHVAILEPALFSAAPRRPAERFRRNRRSASAISSASPTLRRCSVPRAREAEGLHCNSELCAGHRTGEPQGRRPLAALSPPPRADPAGAEAGIGALALCRLTSQRPIG
jgi:hypothetical protein